jgi:hypothetical protein
MENKDYGATMDRKDREYSVYSFLPIRAPITALILTTLLLCASFLVFSDEDPVIGIVTGDELALHWKYWNIPKPIPRHSQVQVIGRSSDGRWLFVWAVLDSGSEHAGWVSVGSGDLSIALDISLLPIVAVPGLWIAEVSAEKPPLKPTFLQVGGGVGSPQWLPDSDLIWQWDPDGQFDYHQVPSHGYLLFARRRDLSPDNSLLLKIIEGVRYAFGEWDPEPSVLGIVDQTGMVLARAEWTPPSIFHGPLPDTPLGIWSPDGKSVLVWDRNNNSSGAPPILVLVPGGDSRIVARGYSPTWTESGDIAFRTAPRGEKLQLVGMDGSTIPTDTPPILASKEIPLFAGGRENSSAIWSSDGTRIAFHRLLSESFHPLGGVSNPFAEWVIANADGTGERVIARTYRTSKASWSPDGRYLAIASVQLHGY